MHTETDRHEHAHARALRAVTAVTLGLFALGATGCSATVAHDIARPVDAPADTADASDAEDASDAAVIADADVSPEADVRCDQDAGAAEWSACCERNGWNWNFGCQAWGPFVPPSMEAV